MGSCFGGLAKAQSSSDSVLGSNTKQNTGQISSQKRRQWSSSPEPEAMENANHMPFINQAAVAWNEMRREWIGNRLKRPHRTPREPTIRWCATYEDLLSTNQPFAIPIPFSEMVDFLVGVWQEEGLHD